MKIKHRWFALLAALVLACPAAAGAESRIAAKISGGEIVVAWKSDTNLSCGTLTLYRDRWPVQVLCAQGRSGYARIPGYAADGGKYSVALRGNGRCITANVPGSAGEIGPDAPVQTPRPTSAPQTGEFSSSLAQDMIGEVNRDRAAYGLSAVSADEKLTEAACIRAKEIVQKFSHTRPDGSSWSSVYSGAYAENIARGYDTAYKCEAAFLSSEGHRENILRAGYSKIGVCALRVNGVTYWVQLFGR